MGMFQSKKDPRKASPSIRYFDIPFDLRDMPRGIAHVELTDPALRALLTGIASGGSAEGLEADATEEDKRTEREEVEVSRDCPQFALSDPGRRL